MAVASFFDKAALGASQILQGFDFKGFQEALEQQVVGITFDEAACTSEGRATLELAVNLLARLYPSMTFRASGDGEGIRVDLLALAKAINPVIGVEEDFSRATVVFTVGNTPSELEVPTFYLGSDGWLAKVSQVGPVGSGKSGNPYGALAAACFGAANLFRLVFREWLPHGALDHDILLSLDNYERGLLGTNSVLEPTDIGETYLVGVGAIGNAAVYALARTQGVAGDLHLIDPETVDATNLQRYLLARAKDVGKSKVWVAARELRSGSGTLRSHRHGMSWGRFLAARGHDALARVAVALDTAEARIGVQASLPKWVVNAWTQPYNLGVSRHNFLNDRACLACLYLPEGESKSESQLVAEEIGLPDAERDVRTLLARGAPVDRPLLERIAEAKGVPLEAILPFEGKSLRDFRAQVVCGGVLLRHGALGSSKRLAHAPMAFQSALAGVMLAAEIVQQAQGKNSVNRTRTEIDLLRPLGTHLSSDDAKHASGRCLCQDLDYVGAYLEKHAASR